MESMKTRNISVDSERCEELGITPRRIEAALWAAEGKTDEEIGQIIGCTSRTAKAHVLGAMEATDTHTRAQMVAQLFIKQVFQAATAVCLVVSMAGGLVDGDADDLIRTRLPRTTARVLRMQRGSKDAA